MTNDILVKIGADITDFSRKMAESNKALRNFTQANQATFDSFKQVGAGITAMGVGIVGGLGYATKQAIDFESSFAGMRKTIDASEAEFQALEKGIRDMAKELPASVHEIAAVGEAAGQLGIKKEAILDFTRTMIDMGESTNMTSDEAATTFARFANIVGMSQDKFSNLGSTVVSLGNNLATTESEIMTMGMRLAAAGDQAGFSEAEILALSGAMSSLGIEAEAGGTAASMVMTKITNAVDKGGKDLEAYAKAAGVSATEFADAWKNEPAKAFETLLAGLNKSAKSGENMTDIFDTLGIKGIRELDVMKRLASGHELLAESRELANKSFGENTALSDEAAQRYETLASQLAMFKNTVIDAAISLGQALVPAVQKVTEFLKTLVERFNGLGEPAKRFIAIGTAIVGVLSLIAGPILLLIGFIPQIIVGFKAIGTVLAALSGPVGWIILAIIGIGAALVTAYNKVEWFRDMVNEAWANIKDAFFTAISWIKDNVVIPIMTEVSKFMGEILGKIRAFWDENGEAIMKLVNFYFENIKIYIDAVMKVISAVIGNAWTIISNVTKVLWGIIKTVVSIGIDGVLGAIQFVMKILQGDWEGAWNTIKDTVMKIWDNIKKFFEDVDLYQVGSDIIQGLINGIGSMATAVWDAAKKIASNVKDSITSFLGIHSPARELITIGKYTGEGFAIGISNMVGAVRKASDKLADAAIIEPKQISMDYATPSGTYASLASAVNGTVDVNAREDMIAGAIGKLEAKLENLRIEMDGREFGRAVSDVSTEGRNQAVRNGGRRRI